MIHSVKFLRWDSNFFGFKIGRISGSVKRASELKSAIAHSKSRGYRCLYFECSKDAISAIQFCKKQGYRCIDQKTLLVKRIGFTDSLLRVLKLEDFDSIRKFRSKDLMDAIRIAQNAIAPQSRFCSDPKFGRMGKELYRQWVLASRNRKFCNAFFVFVQYNKVAGLITARKKLSGMYIDLLGVDQKYQGLGIGTKLIGFCETWALARKVRTLHVVTQGLNRRAMALYLKCGFKVKEKTFFYHLWN